LELLLVVLVVVLLCLSLLAGVVAEGPVTFWLLLCRGWLVLLVLVVVLSLAGIVAEEELFAEASE
jgi:hypothetical protein